MTTSPYGRQMSIAEAAAYLGMSAGRLYGLVRRRAITYHRAAGNPGRRGRGGEYFFYERELDGWIDSTRVEPVQPDADPPAPSTALATDLAVAELMPATRRFR